MKRDFGLEPIKLAIVRRGAMSAKGKVAMRVDWRPSVGCLMKLRGRYPRADLEHYIEEARDHALANGKRYKDFDAYFRNWVRRSMQGKFGPPVLKRATNAVRSPDVGVPGEGGTMSRAEALERWG